MRTISTTQRQALEDLSAEGLLRQLPIQTAEKDIHITDLLKGLSKLEVHHDFFSDLRRGEPSRHDSGIKLVFCGGTCLSKAHGLIGRMSEDIDIKVVLADPDVPFKKGRGGVRARLTALHDLLPKLFEQLEFPLLECLDGSSNPHIRDSHRYYVVGAGYASAYPQLPSLRPELKLELIQRVPLLPTELREFGYLHESMAGKTASNTLSMPCISVAETAAEKVLSLLRRCAFKWDGHQARDMDPTLIRHVYDVHCIAQKSPQSLAAAQDMFKEVMLIDQAEFARQNPEFDVDPVAVLKRTLATAKTHEGLRQDYERRLLPLVYDAAPPSFDQAFASFEAVAHDLLATC